MFLKELQLAGFKSFARPVRLEMAHGVTAIVGPNGSGKSNIVDAVRWVLGEQSNRALRGARSEDVIFAGSADRHPLGMAEVTLVLDNEDGRVQLDMAEISIARRLHRSGETEYLLNRRRARLRDVIDVAGQAGLGADSYCVVGQGSIEQLALQRPQERKGLIADAADVRRHEARLAQVENDLLQVQQSSLRMTAVVVEIRPQLERLRIQAERAERHHRVRQDLHDAARAWYSRSLPGARAAVTDAERHRLKLQSDSAEGRARVAEMERRRAAEQAHAQELRSRLVACELALGPERTAAELLHVEAASVDERLQALTERLAALDVECAAEAQHLREAEVELQRSEAAWREATANAPGPQAGDAEAAFRAADMRAGALRRQVADQRRAVEQAGHEVMALEREVARHQAAREAAATIADESARRRREILAHITDLEAAFELTAASEVDARDWHREFERTVAQLRPLVDASRAAVRRAEAHERATRQEGDTLRGEERALAAMEAHEQLPAERDHLIARLSAPLRFQRAIAAALGEGSRYRVVDAEENAWFPVPPSIADRVIVPARRQVAATLDGVTSWFEAALGGRVTYQRACAVLDAAADVELGMRYLGDVVIVATLEDAVIAATYLAEHAAGRSFRVASQDGHCLAASGEHCLRPEAREAQAIDVRSHRAVAAAQLEDAEARLVVAERETLAARGAAAAAIDALRKAEEQLRASAGDLQRTRDEMVQTRRQLDRERETLQGLEIAKNPAAVGDANAVTSHLEMASERRRQAEAALEVLEVELAAVLEERQTLGERRGRLAAEREAAAEHLGRLHDVAKRDAADVRRITARLETLKSECTRSIEARAGLETRARQLADRAGEATERVKTLDAEHAALSNQLLLAETRIEDATRDLEAERVRWADLRTAEAEAGTEFEHARAIQERLEAELATVAEMLACDPQDLLGPEINHEAGAIAHDEALQRQLSKAQRELRSIGGVDYGVLAEYTTLRDRHAHLTAQLEDLAQTEVAIREGIAEVRALITDQFNRAFQEVNERFKEMFRLLFGGGDAELVISGDVDAPQGGIDIVAQPPGKRLNRLATLSGGERALVGGALLLALIGANPSPFCMLDEVDAALDEANVQRFAATLREMARQTQFIVVTHNRATMEMADALYGVTMTPGAVSQVLAMKLVAPVA